MGNGEAYNGPILSGTSIPTSPRRSLVTTEDVELTLSVCYQHLVHSLFTRLFRGDFKVDLDRSCLHVTTLQSETDPTSFATFLEGHVQLTNRSGREFRAHWGATGAKLVPQRKPPAVPSFWLKVADGNEKSLDDDNETLWELVKFLDLKFFSTLPQYLFSLDEPNDLKSPLFLKERVLSAVIGNDVRLVFADETLQRADYTENGERHKVTLPTNELSKCLQFGLANQFEHRLTLGEAASAR